MFKKLMMPVDLAHVEKFANALAVAADLAKHYACELCYVGVTASAPSDLGRNPKEFAEKLAAFADAQTLLHGHSASTQTVISHDPAVELDSALIKATKEIGADLVVMATHVPKMADMLIPSHGGELARHADISVFLVRHK